MDYTTVLLLACTGFMTPSQEHFSDKAKPPESQNITTIAAISATGDPPVITNNGFIIYEGNLLNLESIDESKYRLRFKGSKTTGGYQTIISGTYTDISPLLQPTVGNQPNPYIGRLTITYKFDLDDQYNHYTYDCKPTTQDRLECLKGKDELAVFFPNIQKDIIEAECFTSPLKWTKSPPFVPGQNAKPDCYPNDCNEIKPRAVKPIPVKRK
jgi:hypothetical protein